MSKARVFGIVLIVLGLAVGGFSAFLFSRASESAQIQERNTAAAERKLQEAADLRTSDPQRFRDLNEQVRRHLDIAETAQTEAQQQRLVAVLGAAGAGLALLGGLVLVVVGRRPRPTPVPAYGPPPGYGPPAPAGYGPPPPGHGQHPQAYGQPPPPGYGR
jgi:hypothetical protein